jgi:hypothetical protein
MPPGINKCAFACAVLLTFAKAMNIKAAEPPVRSPSTAAERLWGYRHRQRRQWRSVRIEIANAEIDALVKRGYVTQRTAMIRPPPEKRQRHLFSIADLTDADYELGLRSKLMGQSFAASRARRKERGASLRAIATALNARGGHACTDSEGSPP